MITLSFSRRVQVGAWLFFCVFCGGGPARAVDAAQVFKSVSPGVVLIEDMDASGSGVAMEEDGRVLTCLHVVSGSVHLNVTADISTRSGQKRMTFTNVPVHRVHAEYDLAELKLPLPAGSKLVTPPLARDREIETGEDCYVIGNPGGVDAVLDRSMSKGIIGSANRVFEKLNYIQITAPVNPGNSGGALCDKDGLVIGIVTFKLTDAEGIGFAIPLAGLKKGGFVKPAARKYDTALAQELSAKGGKIRDYALRSTGRERELGLQLSLYLFRSALAGVPNDGGAYYNVGLVYLDMGKPKAARAFMQRAVELKPSHIGAWKLLGVSAIDEKDYEEAERCFRKGISIEGSEGNNEAERGACIQNIAALAFEQKKFFEASYASRWALSLEVHPARLESVQSIGDRAMAQLADAEYTALASKTGGFSLADMDTMAKRVASSTAGEKRKRASGPAHLWDASKTLEAAQNVMKDAVDVPPEGLKKKLPEEPASISPALGGAYLLMRFPVMGKIGVFNVGKAAFDRYVPTPDRGTVCTAGGNVMVLYEPSNRTVRVLDLVSNNLVATITPRVAGTITDMEMGLLDSKCVFISWVKGFGNLDERLYGMMDLATGAVAPIEGREMSMTMCTRDNFHARLSPDATFLVGWCSSHSPSGFTSARLENGRITSLVYEHTGYGCLTPSASGRRVYSIAGAILDPSSKVVLTEPAALISVLGTEQFLQLTQTNVLVREPVGMGVIRSFALPAPFSPGAWEKTKFTTDRRVLANGYINRLVYIDPGSLVAYVMKLTESGVTAVAPVLGGVPKGTTWKQKLNLPAQTRVVVEDGPPGMAYESASDELVWKIPASQASGDIVVLLSITAPGRDEVYDRISISVR